ncbi:MAG TPA: hypothetical protein VEK39_12710 [Solirubrobacterales bacterium]|nr:hypothetical protein [Solirubrobacterales bacterium]
MAKQTKRVEIGFGGGQVAAVRLSEDQLVQLRKALGADDAWLELSSDDGDLILDLRQIVFVKAEGGPSTIGFSGS